LTKPVADSAIRRRAKDQLDTYCRACRSAYGKEHYAKHRQRYIDQTAARKRTLAEERVLYLLDYFEQNPCANCGETDPLVLEFDPLGEEEKAFNIARGLINRPWSVVLAEMAKCEVVCANCHRRRTATRAGHLRLRLARKSG